MKCVHSSHEEAVANNAHKMYLGVLAMLFLHLLQTPNSRFYDNTVLHKAITHQFWSECACMCLENSTLTSVMSDSLYFLELSVKEKNKVL